MNFVDNFIIYYTRLLDWSLYITYFFFSLAIVIVDWPKEKTKKIYNILGDYLETIVNYAVPRMIKNNKNNKQIIWLTNWRAFGRFLTAGFKKRDFFKE